MVDKVRVAAEIDNPYTNVVDYLPYALRRLTTAGSPNTLSMTVVELSYMERNAVGSFSATMGVEGQIRGKDGALLVAFRTRAYAVDRETVSKNFELVMDKIVWSVSKDLGKDFARSLEVRLEVEQRGNPSGLVPLPPPGPAPQMDVKSRLLRLEDLRQKGLITNDEYKLHKEEILKGL